MRAVSRREFIKYGMGSAATIAVGSRLPSSREKRGGPVPPIRPIPKAPGLR